MGAPLGGEPSKGQILESPLKSLAVPVWI